MGIQFNKDGSMSITLDDNNNLPQEFFDTMGKGSNVGGSGNAMPAPLENFKFPEGSNELLNNLLSDSSELDLLNALQGGIDKGSEGNFSELMQNILKQAEGPELNAKELVNKKLIKDSNITKKDIPDVPLSEEELALVKKLKDQGYSDSFINVQLKKKKIVDLVKGGGSKIKKLYEDYGAFTSPISASDDYIQDVINKQTLEENPDLVGPERDLIEAQMDDYDKSTSLQAFINNIRDKYKDSKSDDKKEKKADSDTTSIMDSGEVKESRKNKEDVTDKKPEKEEPKDERTKIGKIMDGLLSKDDFLMDLGLRLMEGEGVFPGAIKAAKTQKAADTAEAKAALDKALAESLITERLQPADVLQIAQVQAANVNPDPTSKEYKDEFNRSINKQIEKSGDQLSPTELMLLTMMSGGDTQAAAQERLNSYNNQNVASDAVENFKAYNQEAASKS
jgi:hypothetical protein